MYLLSIQQMSRVGVEPQLIRQSRARRKQILFVGCFIIKLSINEVFFSYNIDNCWKRMQQTSKGSEQDQSNSKGEIHSQQDNSASGQHELTSEPHQFDWKNKWLKGQEYSHMLKNIDKYCAAFNFARYPKKTHPESIYSNPENGTVYFVEAGSIGSEFGFPRVNIRKRYRWKKMNFTTHLPKKHPKVTYIVASAVKCERFFPNSKNEGPLFRMHAVMLYKPDHASKQTVPSEYDADISNRYVLCHIRKLDSTYKSGDKNKKKLSGGPDTPVVEIEQSPDEKSIANQSTSQLLEITPPDGDLWEQIFQRGIDYFRLFKHLHNLNCSVKDLE